MVPPTIQEFLAEALNRTLPSPSNLGGFPSLFDVMLPILDFTAASRRIQWATGTITLTGVTHPRFEIPAVPVDEIHVYHAMAASDSVGAGGETWRVLSSYPGVTFPFLEQFSTNVNADGRNFLSSGTRSDATAIRNARPYIVYPRGSVRIERIANGALNDVLTLSVLREILSGPFSSEFEDELITASEV